MVPGGTSQNHFFVFFVPGWPWGSQVVSKVVPQGSRTSQTSSLNPTWCPNATQSDVLGIIFRRLWIVGALLSFLFLASLLGCWGSLWSYKRHYKAHASSNTHATTAHYHQKNIRVGGMRRQPLKFCIPECGEQKNKCLSTQVDAR